MQLTITGKQIEIGDPLRGHVEGSLGSILEKYFGTAIEAHIVFAKEAHLVRAELSIRIGRGIVVNAGAVALDCYVAFDAAAERAAKRLRRYKRRLRQHHAKLRDTPDSGERARDYVLAPPVDESEDDGDGAGLATALRGAGRRRAGGDRRDQHRIAASDRRRGGDAHGPRRHAGAALPQPLAR